MRVYHNETPNLKCFKISQRRKRKSRLENRKEADWLVWELRILRGKMKSERGNHITHNSLLDVLITHVHKQMAERKVQRDG